MGLTIGLAGKGGVGKTTLASLIVGWLVRRGETLGVEYGATVGGIRESARKEAQALKGVSKQEFLDLRVHEALVEHDGFDLVVMGRPEGQGCYCFANNILRDVLDRLSRNYRHIVIDSEAGLEHIARRTLLSLDYLLIVSDATVRGIHTAGRISALADEVALPVKSRGLVVNRTPAGGLTEELQRAIQDTGLPLAAAVPLDEQVMALDARGIPVAHAAPDARVRAVLSVLLESLFANHQEKR